MRTYTFWLFFCSIISIEGTAIGMEMSPAAYKIIHAQEFKESKVPSLRILAAKKVIDSALVKPGYKEEIIELHKRNILNVDVGKFLSSRIQEEFAAHIAHNLQSCPEYSKEAVALPYKPFNISTCGKFICMRKTCSADDENEIQLYDLSAGNLYPIKKPILHTIELIDSSTEVINKQFLTALSWTNDIVPLARLLTGIQYLRKIIVSPDRKSLLLIQDTIIQLLDLQTKKNLYMLDPARFLTMSNAYTCLAYNNFSDENSLQVIDIASGKNIFKIPKEQARHLSFCKQGVCFATHDDKNIYLHSAKDGSLIQKITFDQGIHVTILAFNNINTLNVKLKYSSDYIVSACFRGYLSGRNTVEFGALVVLDPQTGKYKKIEDPKLWNPRALWVDSDVSLAFYSTVQGIRKLWSFELNKAIGIYDPKIMKEKYKNKGIRDLPQEFLVLPTPKVIEGRPLSEVLAIAFMAFKRACNLKID